MTQPVNFVPPGDPTELAPGHYTQSGILNDIFNQILQMTTSLQQVAAAQANRLNILTQWQKAYTDLMAQVPTFSEAGGAFHGSSTSISKTRDDLNRLNAAFTQTLQNRQSVVSDDAKALQSSVNQSNDAVNQQSNLGTAILQELSTLLGTIFH